jgi:hypothetical protein
MAVSELRDWVIIFVGVIILSGFLAAVLLGVFAPNEA